MDAEESQCSEHNKELESWRPFIDLERHQHHSISQPALSSIWLCDSVTPNTPAGPVTLTHTVETVDHDAGQQADRWCADNAVSLEQRTKALRVVQ